MTSVSSGPVLVYFIFFYGNTTLRVNCPTTRRRRDVRVVPVYVYICVHIYMRILLSFSTRHCARGKSSRSCASHNLRVSSVLRTSALQDQRPAINYICQFRRINFKNHFRWWTKHLFVDWLISRISYFYKFYVFESGIIN